MEFKVSNITVYGLERAIKASGNPMRTEIDTSDCSEKDYLRASKLGSAHSGEGHDNFLKGILVHFDVIAPLYWWKQAQRYHWLDFVSSQSTMHCLLKFDVKKQCVKETNPEIIKILDQMVKEFNQLPLDDQNRPQRWRALVASLPCGFCLGATMTTNYQQLKTIYNQRRDHKLEEWHVFCRTLLEKLPRFVELTGVKPY